MPKHSIKIGSMRSRMSELPLCVVFLLFHAYALHHSCRSLDPPGFLVGLFISFVLKERKKKLAKTAHVSCFGFFFLFFYTVLGNFHIWFKMTLWIS